MKRTLLLLCAVGFCRVSAVPARADIGLSSPLWSVEHIVNNAQTVWGLDQSLGPRNNRGLAVSSDGRFVYVGYGDPYWCVRKVELGHAPADNAASVVAQLLLNSEGLGLNWPKAIATDDAGRVYITRDKQIQVYDAGLAERLLTITGFAATNGVHVVRKGPGEMYLYHTERGVTSRQLGRMVLSEATDFAGASRAWTGDASFGANGYVDLGATASNVRGVATDVDGNAWVADNGGTVFRVNAAGSVTASVAVSDAFDVYCDGGQVFVSQSHAMTVTIITRATLAKRTLMIPFASLGLVDAYHPPPSYNGSLAAIDGAPGVGCLVACEAGGSIEPSPFRPGFGDDDEPVVRVRPSADLDRDGDTDLADFLYFQECFNGPNAPPTAACAADADLDADGDVDLIDFLSFQDCFNGPNRPPACH